MSSNSNNISNTLSGIFRSMSRRGQPRGVQTEASNTQHRTDVDMDSQPNPSLPISDVDTAPLNNPSFPTDDGNQSDSSMPVLEDVSDSESDSDAGSLAGDMDVESFDAPSMNIRSQTGTVPSLVQHYDSVIFPDEDEDMSWLGSVQPLPFRPQGTRRARVEEDVEGDSERDRRHPSQRASNNSTPVPSNPGRSATPQVRLPQQQTSYPNSMGSRRHGRRHQHHLPMHFMTQMGIDVQRDSPNSQSPSQSNSASSVSQQASGRPEGNDRPTAHPASRISQLLESLFQAAGEGAGTIHTTVNGIPVTGNIPPADASAGSGGPGRFLGNLFAAMNAVDGGAFTINSGTFPTGFPFFRLHPQEREDPERARILVEGLEDVPVGLLRRLERVSPESSGCAICWEKLLEDDAEYLKREEEQENKKAAECAAKADGTDLIESGSTTSNDAQVAGSSTETLSSQAIKRKIPKYPRIVTLPCAHLFHADCLVPWFTRPNQTTCPTCRFNIDPDNLTRGAGARRAATATVVEGETATETQSGDASLRDVPLTDDSFAIDPTSGMPVRSSDGNTDAAASVGFFRVLEGGLGGPTIVPVPPPSFVSNMGPFLNPPSRSSASWSQTASNSFANTATGGSTSRPSAPSAGANLPSSSTSTANINEGGTRGTDSSSNENTSSTPSVASDIRREDLVYPNAPRLPMARNEPRPLTPEERPPPVLTEEQLRSFTQTFLGRMFGVGAPTQASQPNVRTASQDSESASSDGSSPMPSTQTSRSGTAPQSTARPQPTPRVHFHHPSGHPPHHHAGDGFVTIGFDFVIGSHPRPPGAGQPSTPSENVGTNRGSDSYSGANAEDQESVAAGLSVEGITMGLAPTPGDSNPIDFLSLDLDGSGSFNDDDPQDAFDRLGRTARRFHNSSRANQNASTAAPTDQSSIHLPFSFFGPAVAPASNQQSPGIRREANVRENNNGPPGQPPDISSYISSMLGAAGMNGARRSQPIRSGAHHPRRSARGSTDGPRERRQWAPPPPPPPGLTLRQTIEKREREAGLRCWDVSCGVGPSDEDPFVTISEEQKRQVKIRRISTVDQQGVESKGKGKEKAEEEPEPQYVCEHSFHPSCLVSAQRAALNGSEEVPVGNGKSVEVSCTVCRAIGALPREDWEEGVRALGA